MAQVSVVIPSLGEAKWSTAITSVLSSGQHCGIDTEVILVWQGGGAPEVPDDVIVVPAHRVGTSYARNRGAERGTTSVLGYIDDDEVVDPGWVGAVVEALDDADAAFGPIDALDDEGRPHCLTDHGAARTFGSDTPPWLVGSGGCMALRRDALEAVGGFDLRFGAGAIGRSAEETELIRRLLKAGRRIRWAPGMLVHHPTKTDEEILASRYPYGLGAGRMLRGSRSPRLIANYLHAVAHANVTAMRRRGPIARQEARAFGHGLLTGLATRGRWLSPDLSTQDVPDPIQGALAGRRGIPRPVSSEARPHYVWDCGEVVLHAYTGPTETQLEAPSARERLIALPTSTRIPAIHAHARSRDALWVLEDRVLGEPLVLSRPQAWWRRVAEWVLTYASVEGPRIDSVAAWPGDIVAWSDSAAPELRGAVVAALTRMASRPTGPAHGDLRPENLKTTVGGVAAVGWEWCSAAELRGADLLLLAATHAGELPDEALVRSLLEGRNPSFGDVLGPLRTLGLEGQLLNDTLLLALMRWARDEHRRSAALGTTPQPMLYGRLLDSLTPVLRVDVALAST